MLSSYFSSVKRNLINLAGWRTNRQIVVIESDDWGSVRMASKEAYKHFDELGYRVDECPYNRQESLESNEEMEILLDV